MFIIAYYCNYLYEWHYNNYNNIHNYNNFQAAPPPFVIHVWLHAHDLSPQAHPCACITSIAPKKNAQMQCRRASNLADTSPAQAWSTWLDSAQFHNRSIPEPHTRQAPSQTPPLLEEPTRRCGIVPVSPTGTTGSLPRIDSTGVTYKIGFLWSSSYTIREPIESNQP